MRLCSQILPVLTLLLTACTSTGSEDSATEATPSWDGDSSMEDPTEEPALTEVEGDPDMGSDDPVVVVVDDVVVLAVVDIDVVIAVADVVAVVVADCFVFLAVVGVVVVAAVS